jgi:hypothetical protein
VNLDTWRAVAICVGTPLNLFEARKKCVVHFFWLRNSQPCPVGQISEHRLATEI